MAVRRKYIRSLVENLLLKFNISSPSVDVEFVARSLGVTIQRQPAEDNLSGFILRNPQNSSVVIGVNERHSPNRQRFTIAHEIAHYLLHKGDLIHIDSANQAFEVKLRNENAGKGLDDDEKEANFFAAELLMPAHFIAKDVWELENRDLLTDDDILREMAKKYGVSVTALTFRLAYLNYITLAE